MWQKGVEAFIDPFSLPIEAVFPLVVLVIVVYTAWYSYNYPGIALYSVLPLLLVPGIAVLILLVAGIAVLPLLAPGIAEQIGTPPLQLMKSNARKKDGKYVSILQGLGLIQAATTECRS